MELTYRPIKVWPEGWNQSRPPIDGSPFTATWSNTLRLLERELDQLKVTEAVIQCDMRPQDFRLDGSWRANAKPNYPGVILSVVTRKHGTLTYPCNRFGGSSVWENGSRRQMPGWQENVRAIALGLEALRKVERYGIAERGQQYAGWAELPSGIAVGTRKQMTVDEAARILAEGATLAGEPCDGGDLQWDENEVCHSAVKRAYRAAARIAHPDNGGTSAMFDRLNEAYEYLMEQPGHDR